MEYGAKKIYFTKGIFKQTKDKYHFRVMEGFHIIKAIGREAVEPKRILSRDTQSYFGILLDDNNRKPICRLHFNRLQKYVGIFDENKKEIRHPIGHIDDIYKFAEDIKKAIICYEK